MKRSMHTYSREIFIPYLELGEVRQLALFLNTGSCIELYWLQAILVILIKTLFLKRNILCSSTIDRGILLSWLQTESPLETPIKGW